MMPTRHTEVTNVTLSAQTGNNVTDPDRDDVRLEYLLLLIFPCATILGNSLVVTAICTQKGLKTSTNFLLLSLATADLLVGSIVMPFSIYLVVYNFQWFLGAPLCDFFIIMDVSLSTSSITNLMAISVDRFYAVVRHLEYRGPKQRSRIFLEIGLAWAFSLGLGLPLGIGLNTRPAEGSLTCGIGNADFMLYGTIFAFIIPSLVMCVMYGVVFYRLHQQMLAVRVQEKAASRFVRFGHNLNQMIKSAHECTGTDGNDLRSRMMKFAIPFAQRDAGADSASDDDSVCSHDIEELINILDELDEPQPSAGHNSSVNSNSTPIGSTAKPDYGTAKPTRQLGKVVRQISFRTRHRLSSSASSTNKTMQRRATQGLRNVKDRAFELVTKMRSKQGTHVRKETRATKLVVTVMIVFLLCWTPFFTTNLIQAHMLISDPTSWTSHWDLAFLVFTWCGYLNSCLNPVIYGLLNKRFRNAFSKLLHLDQIRTFFRKRIVTNKRFKNAPGTTMPANNLANNRTAWTGCSAPQDHNEAKHSIESNCLVVELSVPLRKHSVDESSLPAHHIASINGRLEADAEEEVLL